MLKSRRAIEAWVDMHTLGSGWIINDDLTVDVEGHARIYNVRRLPIQLRYVEGNLVFFQCKLTTLKGCPASVKGNFDCSRNELKSVLHMPTHVGGKLNFSHNQIANLQHLAKTVGADIDCSHNQLTSIAGLPRHVEGSLNCSNNKLTSMHDCPTVKDSVQCYQNPILGIEGLQWLRFTKTLSLDQAQARLLGLEPDASLEMCELDWESYSSAKQKLELDRVLRRTSDPVKRKKPGL